MFFYVYVLRSEKDRDLYIGYTADLRERVRLHNSGKIISTRKRVPFELLYYEAYKNEKDARRRETQLKNISSQRESLKKRLKESLK